jgi:hypothetical protein
MALENIPYLSILEATGLIGLRKQLSPNIISDL